MLSPVDAYIKQVIDDAAFIRECVYDDPAVDYLIELCNDRDAALEEENSINNKMRGGLFEDVKFE